MITEQQRLHILTLKDTISKIVGQDIATKNRKRQIVQARMVFYKIVKDIYPLITLEELGKFVNTDHSTVTWCLTCASERMKYNDFKTLYVVCEEACKNSSHQEGVDSGFLDEIIPKIRDVKSVMVLELVVDHINSRISQILG